MALLYLRGALECKMLIYPGQRPKYPLGINPFFLVLRGGGRGFLPIEYNGC